MAPAARATEELGALASSSLVGLLVSRDRDDECSWDGQEEKEGSRERRNGDARQAKEEESGSSSENAAAFSTARDSNGDRTNACFAMQMTFH